MSSELDYTDKANKLAAKMNNLTDAFDVSDEMVISGEDIIETVIEKTNDIKLYSDSTMHEEVVNLEMMIDDFKYIRETLKETTSNGRRVLNSVTLDLLDTDVDGTRRDELIISFTNLNRAVGDNMKLYMQSYKDISSVLVNIDKIKNPDNGDKTPSSQTINNNLIISESVSTAEVLKRLKNKLEEDANI